MTLSLRQPYEDLDFMSPLSDSRAQRLERFLARDLDGTVLDIGCGWGELLMRVLKSAPSARGVGVDLDEGALARARELAQERGLTDRVRFLVRDGSLYEGEPAQAAICIGASQIWSPPESLGQPVDYARALRGMRSRLERCGRLLYGGGIWSCGPSSAAVESLGGRPDEFLPLSELLETTIGCGFTVVAVHEASLDEWDEFESGYAARYARWLAEQPKDHPDVPEVLQRAALQRERYFGGYRGVLGMAYLCLLAV